MFHAFGLRFVTLMLVSLCQGVLSLLSIANVVVALSGTSTTLPILIIATNVPMSISIAVILVLDYMKRSPLSVLSETVLCAAAGLLDLISAVTILFFSVGDTICKARSSLNFWNACGAHFAVIALLWTATFLLTLYAICLAYVAKRYSQLHPLDQDSVWKKKVQRVNWDRADYSPNNPPGRRLHKQGPDDIESLRRVIVDKDSQTLSRQMAYVPSSSLPATPSRPIGRPPGLDSPVGFAERMGYFRRDAQGEYVPSTPTLRRESPLGDPHRVHLGVERGAVFRMQTPAIGGTRRPSFPELPNPFPPNYTFHGTTPPAQGPLDVTSRSWQSSHSSANSSGNSPGFAGLGAGPELQKEPLRISVPVPLGSPGRGGNSPSTRSAQASRNSMFLGGQQRPFQISAPLPPINAPSPTPPRRSLQPARPPTLPASPRPGELAGAQNSYPRKYSLPQSSLATTVSTPVAYRPTSLSPPQTRPRTGSASNPVTLTRPAFLQPTLPTLPPATLSPSTKQRVSNSAYPLPLPPLSTYPIKSVAASARPSTQERLKVDPLFLTEEPVQSSGQTTKDRPLSTISTVSCYSTSSASHGPPPIREYILSLTSPTQTEDLGIDKPLQRSDSALSRRSSKSKKPAAVTRSTSRHGDSASQTLWGGTGNGPTRRSLASQFQRPRAQQSSQNGGRY